MLNLLHQFILIWSRHNCSLCWCCCSDICYEITESKIGFMSNSWNNGCLTLKIALTTSSSLKFHKSSIDPPPRPTIIVSTPSESAYLIFFIISSLACVPCTKVLIWIFRPKGYLLFIVDWISLIAAPVLAVKIAIF